MIAFRPATSDDRALVAVAAAAVGAGSALAVAAAPHLPALAGALPACPFHALTGVPCPGCGTTRAALALAAGDPLAAVAFNPLATLAAGAAFVFALAAPAWLLARGPVPRFAAAPAGGLPRGVRIAFVAALVAQWAWLVLVGR